MMGRNRRGNRQASMKARLGIAAAVLLGGGAVGVAAVAASNHHATPATAQSDAFIMHFHHRISEQTALSSAIGMWATSHQRSLTTLAQMVPMSTFSQVRHHRTVYAAQRGVVVLATNNFLLVKSAHGQMHLWWLTGATQFMNVSANPAGMTAMVGNNTAAVQAMNQNMVPAANTMAGGASVVNQMAAPVTKPVTVTVDTGTQVITITITGTTATVTQPGATMSPTMSPTMSATPTMSASPTMSATPTMSAMPTPTVTSTQPVTTTTNGVARGDLVFIAGVRTHGMLIAKLVLFSVPPTTMPTATPTTTATATPTMTATPSATPTMTGTSAPTFSGHGS